MLVLASLPLAYLLGAIPFSLIIGKSVKGIDLREHGSGNLGATNVYRNLGAWWGGLCLFLDVAKGAGAVLLTTAAVTLAPEGPLPLHLTGDIYRIIAGMLGTLGHSFSPFASFRGGKGIATTAGAFIVLEPLGLAVALLAFFSVFFATRIVSLASICAAAMLPVSVLFFEFRSGDPSLTLIIFTVVVAGLAIWRHRANIRRLQEGTEQKLASPNGEDLDTARAAADQALRDLAPPEPPLNADVDPEDRT